MEIGGILLETGENLFTSCTTFSESPSTCATFVTPIALSCVARYWAVSEYCVKTSTFSSLCFFATRFNRDFSFSSSAGFHSPHCPSMDMMMPLSFLIAVASDFLKNLGEIHFTELDASATSVSYASLPALA